jgi:hypothetical protein
LFYLFFPTEFENGGAEWVLPGGKAGTSARGEVLGKGGRRWIWCNKMCTHVSKCKSDTCWNYSRNQGRERWRMDEEVNSCIIYLIHCKYLYICHSVPPPCTTIEEKKRKRNTNILRIGKGRRTSKDWLQIKT